MRLNSSIRPHSVVPPPSTTASDGDSSHTAHLTNGQIAGLIVGCIVGSGCCFSILYFLIIANHYSNNNSKTINNNKEEFQRVYFDDTITINVGGVDAGSTHQMAKHDEGELSLIMR